MEKDLEAKRLSKKDRNKELAVNVFLGLTGVGLPLAFYAYWMNKGFQFEQTGTFTSSTFKNLFKVFKPTKIGQVLPKPIGRHL